MDEKLWVGSFDSEEDFMLVHRALREQEVVIELLQIEASRSRIRYSNEQIVEIDERLHELSREKEDG